MSDVSEILSALQRELQGMRYGLSAEVKVEALRASLVMLIDVMLLMQRSVAVNPVTANNNPVGTPAFVGGTKAELRELTVAELSSILMDANNVPEQYRGDSGLIVDSETEAQAILNAVLPGRLCIMPSSGG